MELLHLHSGGKVSKALAMALDTATGGFYDSTEPNDLSTTVVSDTTSAGEFSDGEPAPVEIRTMDSYLDPILMTRSVSSTTAAVRFTPRAVLLEDRAEVFSTSMSPSRRGRALKSRVDVVEPPTKSSSSSSHTNASTAPKTAVVPSNALGDAKTSSPVRSPKTNEKQPVQATSPKIRITVVEQEKMAAEPTQPRPQDSVDKDHVLTKVVAAADTSSNADLHYLDGIMKASRKPGTGITEKDVAGHDKNVGQAQEYSKKSTA